MRWEGDELNRLLLTIPVRVRRLVMGGVLAVLVNAVVGPRVRAQDSAAVAATPRGCIDAIRRHERDEFLAARREHRHIDIAKLRAESAERARACAARFDPATIPPAWREDLGTLYLLVGDAAHAHAAFAAVLDVPGLSDSARASTIVRIMSAYGNAPQIGADTVLASAERLVAMVDSIPGVAMQKVQAHGMIMGWYHDPGTEAKVTANANAVLALVGRLSPSEQKASAFQLLDAFQERAAEQASALHVDSALATLLGAPQALPGIPDAQKTLADAVALYRQVGQPAPAVHADYRINGDAKPFAGRVSILSFTANWCKPCKVSYPGLQELSKRYASKGLQVELLVDLDGTFGGVRMNPPQEVEANRKYFDEEHGLSFPIAIQRSAFRASVGETAPPADTANSRAYHVHVLPSFFVIDRHGVIRGVLQGWDPGGDIGRALAALVDRLLAQG